MGGTCTHGPDCRVAECRGLRYFANSTEWEIWEHNWCGRCVRDAFARRTNPDYSRGCKLIADGLAGLVVPQWLENDVTAVDPVTCIDFKPYGYRGGTEPIPKPPPPGQGRLFEPASGRRMLVAEPEPVRTMEMAR